MSSAEERFHEEWLGLVQPVDGLVVSIPVLVEAQCASRQSPERQRRLVELCSADPPGARATRDAPRDADVPALHDVAAFLVDILGWTAERQLTGEAVPAQLRLYVPEGGQIIQPTLALRAASEGAPPVLLFWDLGADCAGLPLDRPETRTGPWAYPVTAKFDRLLRHARVPIGVLTNRTQIRLIYAPHGESSGSITFRLADMAKLDGRPILDAMVMLLGATRLFGVAPDRQLPAILAESRKRQANVTNELADQVFDALQILLHGFAAAAERDGRAVLDAAYARTGDHLYGGLLTQLLRLVFVLYAEDRSLLPIENELYAEHLSVLGLFEELQADHGAHSDSMSRRFGAYGRLTALFRAIYLGVEHGELRMPPRRGQLFSPYEYPFLEGWDGEPGSAPVVDPAARAATRVPSIDDETVFRVLEKLLVLRRQRLSYRALDVEQIGSVYEALMGYHVVRLEAEAVCLRPSRVWVTGEEILAEKPATRTRWLQETTGMAKAQADKLNRALAGLNQPGDVLDVLEDHAVAASGPGGARRPAGRLVIQPGPERRRTSSHYTPRSLTAPIVAQTLEPLIRAMGDRPSSERILNLKVCDPAMGSGAFLVEACRYLADQVMLAWAREGRHDLLSGQEDATLLARRLVAQRCLYGVDKNAYAVNLAKLSLWLVTLARDLPFSFVDHALRHGDSLVGLSFDQITAFHWQPRAQVELCQTELKATLDEAITARQRILELAADPSPAAQKAKEWLLQDAEDALERVRLIGDLIVGAYFSTDKEREREKERERRLELVLAWLRDGRAPGAELVSLRQKAREQIASFHWMAEFPEVFWAARPDPLGGDLVGGRAWIDAFVGNPPFSGKNGVVEFGGPAMPEWLKQLHEETHGNADYCAHFFRRADVLLGTHGTIGLIATNTIAQGDTRTSGLRPLVARGLVIYHATASLPWPGDAAVTVSVIHLAKGDVTAAASSPCMLDGKQVAVINSRLRPAQERPDPVALREREGQRSQGCVLQGEFDVSLEEGERLRAKSRNADIVRPYIGGEELNTRVLQDFERYVIHFGARSLEEAGRWAELLDLVRERVKPARDRLGNNSVALQAKKLWWRFWAPRPELYERLGRMRRCLVTAAVSKHWIVSWQPADRVFAHTLYIFLFERNQEFAVLQSRAHEIWVRLLSSTMEDRLRYAASDCFDTFPFPSSDLEAESPDLEEIGRRLHEARAACMASACQGMTQTYNRLKDPGCHDPEIVRLRELHLELDREVLTAYGWSDLIDSPGVPQYTLPRSEAEKQAFSAFEDAVVDRLFALNAERAAAERTPGMDESASSAAASKRKKPAARGKAARPARERAVRAIPSQLDLESSDD